MSFKARYIGADGTTRDLDAENAEAAARSIRGITMGSSRSDAKSILAQVMANRGLKVGRKFGEGKKQETKVADGSAVTKKPDGSICLRGEETTPLVEGAKMYGSVNGRKDYFSLAEFDDKVDGGVVGEESTSPSPNAGTRSAHDKGGWRIPVSRTAITVEPSLEMKCNKVTVYDLMSFYIMSESGRIVGKTKETKREVASFFALIDGEGTNGANGKFGVMLIADIDKSDPVHPIPVALAFGSEADLGTYDEESKTFACNYDSGGLVLDNPPVKVVGIAEPDTEVVNG